MDVNNINPLVLAYIGDGVYELYIRKYLLTLHQSKVDTLQKMSTNYVSAKSQSNYLLKMINENIFTELEMDVIKRARNYKRRYHPKNTDIIVYKQSTGLEALIGYLYLKEELGRLDYVMNYIMKGETNESIR